MTPFRMLDLLGEGDVRLTNGLGRITLPADGFLVLAPEIHPEGGYSSYKRVQ